MKVRTAASAKAWTFGLSDLEARRADLAAQRFVVVGQRGEPVEATIEERVEIDDVVVADLEEAGRGRPRTSASAPPSPARRSPRRDRIGILRRSWTSPLASIRMARKSLTLVRVGPVTTSAGAANSPVGVVVGQRRGGARPGGGARERVGRQIAPALSSLRRSRRCRPRSPRPPAPRSGSGPARAGIRCCARRGPYPRTVTVVSPPDRSTRGGRRSPWRRRTGDAGHRRADLVRFA